MGQLKTNIGRKVNERTSNKQTGIKVVVIVNPKEALELSRGKEGVPGFSPLVPPPEVGVSVFGLMVVGVEPGAAGVPPAVLQI